MEPAVLEAAFRHIDAARRDGKACLVHCKKGTSRSCSLVIGYLMQFGEGMSLLAAFEFCQAKRRQVRSVENERVVRASPLEFPFQMNGLSHDSAAIIVQY